MKNGICFLGLPRQPPQQWVDTSRNLMLRCKSCKGSPGTADFFDWNYAEPGLFSNVFMLPFQGLAFNDVLFSLFARPGLAWTNKFFRRTL